MGRSGPFEATAAKCSNRPFRVSNVRALPCPTPDAPTPGRLPGRRDAGGGPVGPARSGLLRGVLRVREERVELRLGGLRLGVVAPAREERVRVAVAVRVVLVLAGDRGGQRKAGR